MHNAHFMKERQCRRELGHGEPDSFFRQRAQSFEVDYWGPLAASWCDEIYPWTLGKVGLTAKVSPQHKIQNEETVFVVLEGIAQIHDKWMVNLDRDPVSGSVEVDDGELTSSRRRR